MSGSNLWIYGRQTGPSKSPCAPSPREATKLAAGGRIVWDPGGTFVCVDLETTGTDPERDRVIEFGAVRFAGGRPAATFSRTVRPEMEVPGHILRLTGIDPAELDSSPPAGEVIREYLAFLGGEPLVGHNLHWDLEFLRRVAQSYGLDLEAPILLDTLALSRVFFPREPSYSLDSLRHTLMHDAGGQRHRAVPDAEASGRLLGRIWARARAAKPSTLRAAVSWLEPAREQLPGVAAFFEAALELGRDSPPEEPPGPAEFPGPPEQARAPASVSRGQVEELVEGAFSGGGILARVVPGFEVRPEQAEMAGAVLKCMTDGGALAVEAGTGVGKSLAYLLPAVAVAEGTGERVVVSTHTITLQDQLAERDLPLVAEALGRPVSYSVLKGRGNYVCLRKWDEFISGALVADEPERLFGLRLLLWLEETPTGDGGELNLSGRELECWEQVAADESCWGTFCPMAKNCFANLARERAARSDIVIANHSLVCADFAAENRVLPAYRHLIIDEAHHFEAVATEHVGLVADREQLAGLLGQLRPGLGRGGSRRRSRWSAVARTFDGLPAENVRHLSEAAGQALLAVDRLYRTIGPPEAGPEGGGADGASGTVELRYGPEMRGLPEGAHPAALEAATSIGGACRVGASLATSLPQGEPETIELGKLTHSASLAAGAVEHLARADRPDWVYWAERNGSGVRLRGVPVFVGEELKRKLWSQLGSVTMVSATLAVSGSFDHFLESMGLSSEDGPQPATVLLRCPFDFERQVLLCVPNDLPLPEGPSADRRYAAGLADFLGALLPLTRGRALVLFTSNRLLRRVHAMTSEELASRGLNVYAQGINGGRSRLLRALRSEERVAVYGSATFWEGVDVRGPQLSCLVITRLPFPRPDQPLVAARLERLAGLGEDPFTGYMLPRAVLRFKQGFGRLIRSGSDRGVVVVLDGRLLRRRYGTVFARSVPRPAYCTGSSEQVLVRVREFLAETEDEDQTEDRPSARPRFVWSK